MSVFDNELHDMIDELKRCKTFDDFETLGKKKPYSTLCKQASYGFKLPHGIDHLLKKLPEEHRFFLLSYILGIQARTDGRTNEKLVGNCEVLLFSKTLLRIKSCLEGYADVFRVWFTFKREWRGHKTSLIEPLATLIGNFQRGNSKMLTPIHCELLHIMWDSRMWDCWEYSVDLCELPKGGLKIIEFLRYFYYAGCIHLLHKRYVQAIQSFAVVLTIPREGNIISTIQVDAIKRYKLACLIHYGKPVDVPCSKSRFGWTNLESQIPKYVEIEQAFKESLKGKIIKLDDVFDKHLDALKHDKNLGLCKRVRNAVYRQRVRELTKVYLAIPVNKIAELVFKENKHTDDDTLLMLVDMKQNGEISFEVEELLSLEEPCQIIRFKRHVDLLKKAEEVMNKVKELSASMVSTSRVNEKTTAEGATGNKY